MVNRSWLWWIMPVHALLANQKQRNIFRAQNWKNPQVAFWQRTVRIFFCFQASSFQLLKLENSLWWSFFTFIYNRSSKMNYFICFTSCRNIVARCKFLVTSLYNVNDAAHSIRASYIQRGRRAKKFKQIREIQENSQKHAEYRKIS